MKKITPFIFLFFIFSCGKDKIKHNEPHQQQKVEVSGKEFDKNLTYTMTESEVLKKTNDFIISSSSKIFDSNELSNGTTGQERIKCPLLLSQSAFLTERSYYDGDCPNRFFLLKIRWIVSEVLAGWCPGNPVKGQQKIEGVYDYTFSIAGQTAVTTPYIISYVNTTFQCGSGAQQFYTANHTYDVYFIVSELEYDIIPYYYNGTAIHNSCSTPFTVANLEIDKTLNYCAAQTVGGVSRVPSTASTAVVYTESSQPCIWPWTILPQYGQFSYRVKNSGLPWNNITTPGSGTLLTGLSSGTTYEYQFRLYYSAPLNCFSILRTGEF
jgi:hypothetical protein